MSPEHLLTLADEKQAAGEAIARGAETHPDDSEKAALKRESKKLLAEAKRLRIMAHESYGILNLEPTLPQAQIDRERSTQSIKIGADFFLPLFRSGCVALPLVFVRSNLFPGTMRAEAAASNKLAKLDCWSDDYAITIKGPYCQLSSFDRAVFAACLLHFQNRALSAEDEDDEPVTTNPWTLSNIIGIGHGSGVAKRIRESLGRLSLTGITVVYEKTKLELKSLISIESSEGSLNKIKIRVPQLLAVLYKKNQWWSIPLSVITQPGLAGWLGCYYSSHKRWDAVTLEKLRKLSGLVVDGYDFKTTLKKALISLQDESVPESARIKSYDFARPSKDNSEVLTAISCTMIGPSIRKKLA